MVPKHSSGISISTGEAGSGGLILSSPGAGVSNGSVGTFSSLHVKGDNVGVPENVDFSSDYTPLFPQNVGKCGFGA